MLEADPSLLASLLQLQYRTDTEKQAQYHQRFQHGTSGVDRVLNYASTGNTMESTFPPPVKAFRLLALSAAEGQNGPLLALHKTVGGEGANAFGKAQMSYAAYTQEQATAGASTLAIPTTCHGLN